MYLTGYSYAIVSGPDNSMAPQLHNCDVVIVDTNQNTVEDVKENDVVVFKYERKNVIHKVILKDTGVKGTYKPFLVTKGINNEYLDRNISTSEDIYGVMVYEIESSYIC